MLAVSLLFEKSLPEKFKKNICDSKTPGRPHIIRIVWLQKFRVKKINVRWRWLAIREIRREILCFRDQYSWIYVGTTQIRSTSKFRIWHSNFVPYRWRIESSINCFLENNVQWSPKTSTLTLFNQKKNLFSIKFFSP